MLLVGSDPRGGVPRAHATKVAEGPQEPCPREEEVLVGGVQALTPRMAEGPL